MKSTIACDAGILPTEDTVCDYGASDGDIALASDAIDQLVEEGKAAALSPNTQKAYCTGWRSWTRWAEARGLPTLPAEPDHLQSWLATLWQEGKKPTTLRTYLAAVGYEHRDCLGDNPAQHPDVRRLMNGIDRRAAAAGYEPKQATPLRQHHIVLIAQHTFEYLAQPNLPAQTIQRALTDLAMITVSHDALLRSGELLALRWGDISRSDEAETGRVLIRRSKTDQTGQGAVCPISADALEALECIRPPDAQPHHRIFPVSASTLRRRLKAIAQQVGIDPAGVSTHSPRIGMAQDLAAAGADMAALMIAGRWKQPATVARYIRNLSADHTPVAQYLQAQDRFSDNPRVLQLLAEGFSRLHARAARLHPVAENATRKALSFAGAGLPRLAQSLL